MCSPTSLGVRGYGFWMVPQNSLAFVLIHPNSPSVEATNSTLGPVFDWAARNNGTQMGSFGTVHPTFYDMFTTYITDVGIAVPSWLGGRLISSQALLKNSTEMAKLIVGDGILRSSINIGMYTLLATWIKDLILCSWWWGGQQV